MMIYFGLRDQRSKGVKREAYRRLRFFFFTFTMYNYFLMQSESKKEESKTNTGLLTPFGLRDQRSKGLKEKLTGGFVFLFYFHYVQLFSRAE
jgi:hypothetical protein